MCFVSGQGEALQLGAVVATHARAGVRVVAGLSHHAAAAAGALFMVQIELRSFPPRDALVWTAALRVQFMWRHHAALQKLLQLRQSRAWPGRDQRPVRRVLQRDSRLARPTLTHPAFSFAALFQVPHAAGAPAARVYL